MVNVDHLGKGLNKFWTEYLHILGQHHQIDVVVLEQLQLLGFGKGLGLWCHGDIVKVNAKLFGNGT